MRQEPKQSLSHVVSDLNRPAIQPPSIAIQPGVIPTLPRKEGARPVTLEHVKELQETEDS